MARILRVGTKVISPRFITSWDIHPGFTWESADEDEKRPRLYIHLVGPSFVEVTEREAKDAGYADLTGVETRLIAMLDALTDG